MKVISVVNFKGGTGKSSLCENLGYTLSQQGKRVLIIDGDRQRNSTTTLLGGQYTDPTIKEVIEDTANLESVIIQAHYQELVSEDPDDEEKNVYEDRQRQNLFIAPSHKDLEKASVYLSANRKAFYKIRHDLQSLKDQPDIVLIDHAGAYSPVMETLLLASDGVIIPCELEPYCVRGMFDMYEKLKAELPDHELANYGIVPYAINRSKAMTTQYLEELEEAFGELVIQSVCTDANVPKAQSCFETIFEYKPRPGTRDFKSPSQEDFRKLAKKVLEIAEVK
jgi:chromosome partitioning protein